MTNYFKGTADNATTFNSLTSDYYQRLYGDNLYKDFNLYKNPGYYAINVADFNTDGWSNFPKRNNESQAYGYGVLCVFRGSNKNSTLSQLYIPYESPTLYVRSTVDGQIGLK